MMQNRLINGKRVHEDLYTMALDIKNRGGKVFFILGDDVAGGCTNCNGNSYHHLRYVTAGPFETVPQSSANNGGVNAATWDIEEKAWYLMKTKGFACPVCRDS